MEAVVSASDGNWYGYYHNERVATVCGNTTKAVPRIGAARSKDHGATWYDLGIILEASESTFVCNTNNRYFVGGVGDLSVVLDRSGQFLYVFFSQYGRTVAEQGVGVARMVWGDRDRRVKQGAGTDKFAGQEARFFMSGRSTYIIRFNRRDVPSTR